jgi:hypothetical protein
MLMWPIFLSVATQTRRFAPAPGLCAACTQSRPGKLADGRVLLAAAN